MGFSKILKRSFWYWQLVMLSIKRRWQYESDEGEYVTLIALVDGSFLLTPVMTREDRWGDRAARALTAASIFANFPDLPSAYDLQ
jgi:hypothetical protein